MIWPTGAKLDIPTADFWYMRDGKIQEFNCHIGTSAMFAQLGVLPDSTSAVGVRARTITPTGKGARLLSSRALQAGLRGAGWRSGFVTPWTSTRSRPSISMCASTP